ncbi:MAG: PfkB family carbohydrate kinase, partial [Desulfobacteraceae bacterium]
ALGAGGLAVSTVGNDRRGRKAIDELKKRGLDVECISIDEQHPTGYVEARLDDRGIATYKFPDDVAWDHLSLNRRALEIAPKLDAVCFGTLAQRSPVSRQAIRRFLAKTSARALKIYDINLRQTFYTQDTIIESLELADMVKLNEEELPVMAGMLGITGKDGEMLETVVKRFGLKLAVLTRGGRGSLLVSPEERSQHSGFAPTHIADTVGAGDSFTAVVAIGLLDGDDLETINARANRVAAYVCSRTGAMPDLSELR